MNVVSYLLLAAICLAGIARFWKLYCRFTGRSIRHIAGPPSNSWLYGNLPEYFEAEVGAKDFEWQARYGDAMRLKAPLGQNYLMLLDPKALQYIYQRGAYRFPKHAEQRILGHAFTGPGLIWADGEHHKRQRRVMLPGFGWPETKALLPVFSASVIKMTSIWEDIVNSSIDESVVIDVHWHASRATMDILGGAAFDYNFGAQEDKGNALANAYNNLFFDTFKSLSKENVLFMSLIQFVPTSWVYSFFKHAPAARLKHARETEHLSDNLARELLKEKSAALLDGDANHDVLSLIVKANASEDPRSQMTETDMVAQLRTLILAGHETTANTVTWIAYELSRQPRIQDKLRKEIREVEERRRARGAGEWTPQELDSMSYLNAVIKEGLRYHPIVFFMERQAGEDDVIPLSRPITATTGEILHEIPIQKGQKIIASVAGYNRNKDVFGEDADVFDPERWLDGKRVKTNVGVGVYANLMTFSAGLRGCIGWRFAFLELQTFIAEMVSKFEFSMTPEAERVYRAPLAVMSPTIDGQTEKGNQLPLKIRMALREQDMIE